MEEYLKMHTPQSSTDFTSKSRQKNDALGSGRLKETSFALPSSEVVTLAEENFDYIGKLPDPVSGSEPMGLGTREILRSVNFKLPANSVPREDLDQEEPSDIDSVFQEHLDNMLQTIKKAKSSSKKKVPELRGLIPSVIPQVLVENTTQQENVSFTDEGAKEIEKTTSSLLNVHKNLPKNSPPPTAGEMPPKEPLQSLSIPTKKTPNEELLSDSIVAVPDPSNLNVTERLSSQPVKDNDHPQPKTPHSVQSNRSTSLVIPTVVLDEAPHSLANNSEVRIMTASVDLIVPSGDDDAEGAITDHSRLEVTITSMPVAPPSSIAESSDGSQPDIEAD